MRRIIRYTGFIFLSLVLLSIIAIALASMYRQEILGIVNQKLREEIRGEVGIGGIHFTIFHDFPNVSIALQKVYIRDTLTQNNFQHDFLNAEKIDINVAALKLLRKEISINSIDVINGKVFIFKTKSGYSNLEIFKKRGRKDTVSVQMNELNFSLVRLNHLQAVVHDSLAEKEYAVDFIKVVNEITRTDSIVSVHLSGDLKFNGLMFNAEKGIFLENKQAFADLHLDFTKHTGELTVTPSVLKLKKSTLKLAGRFLFSDPRSFNLTIQSDDLDYAEGVSVLPDKMSARLTKFELAKNVQVTLAAKGLLNPGAKADVDLEFSTHNNSVIVGKAQLGSLTFKGSLTNHADSTRANDHLNTVVVFDSLYDKLNGLGFGVNGSVRNLNDPLLDARAKFDFNLKEVNTDTIDDVKLEGGRFVADLSYQGRLDDILKASQKNIAGKVAGEIQITDGAIDYQPRHLRFEHTNAKIQFTNNQFRIEDLSVLLNSNPLTVRGVVNGYVPFFYQSANRVKATLSLVSPRLDLEKIFIKKKVTQTRKKAGAKKRAISDVIDGLYKELECDVSFDVEQLVNRKFKGENLKGKILLANNRLLLKDMNMRIAGGNMNFTASLNQLQKNINPFVLSAKIKNARINELFSGFGNFNQKKIRSENLSGRVNVDVNLRASINDDLNILMSTVRGDVAFKLKNGRLKNFEPLQKVGLFVFKNRDLSDVQFAEINARFKMEKTELDISRMEVQSTLLTLFLEGRYSLKDSTDISIQVPLSNLKSRNQDIPPENIGVDKKAGASIFLRAHPDKDGATVVTYDPFHKLKKKKQSKGKKR